MVDIQTTLGERRLFGIDFDIADPPQFSMFKRKRYDLGTALVIWFLLNEGDAFIDVGANNGYLSSVASRKVGSSGLVVSIEPNMTAFKRLLERRSANIFPLDFPVSDFCGKTLELRKPFHRQTTSGYYVPGRMRKKHCRSVTLDYIYEKFTRPSVKLVKVDTEGAELLVMRGAKQLLMKEGPYCMLEVSEEYSRRFGYGVTDIFSFMKEMGYDKSYFIDDIDVSISSINSASKCGQILFSMDELSPNGFQS